MRKSNKQTWFFNVIICKHSGVFFIIFWLDRKEKCLSVWSYDKNVPLPLWKVLRISLALPT